VPQDRGATSIYAWPPDHQTRIHRDQRRVRRPGRAARGVRAAAGGPGGRCL